MFTCIECYDKYNEWSGDVESKICDKCKEKETDANRKNISR